MKRQLLWEFHCAAVIIYAYQTTWLTRSYGNELVTHDHIWQRGEIDTLNSGIMGNGRNWGKWEKHRCR